jgi:serine/threonine protein phosphatase PrpC
LLIVADGMGGHNAGEVASRMAVESIHGFLRRTSEGEDVTWPYGIEARLSLDANRLRTAVKLANHRVFRAADRRDEYTGMGTTVVVALVSGRYMVYSGVGDSRLYRWSDGQFSQLTKDDSFVALARREGSIGASEAEDHPMRHVLTNAIGAQDRVEFEVNECSLAPGDRLLLCSDGLYTEIDEETMAAVLSRGTAPEGMANELVEAVLGTRARDNVTALVAVVPPEA